MLQLDVRSVLRCDFVVLTVRLGLGNDHVCWFCRHKRCCTLFQRLIVNIRRFHGYKRWNCLSACGHRRVVGRNVDLCIRTFPLSSDMNHLVTPLIYLMTLQRGLTRRLGTIGHNKVIHNKICTLVGYVIIKLLHLEQLQQLHRADTDHLFADFLLNEYFLFWSFSYILLRILLYILH